MFRSLLQLDLTNGYSYNKIEWHKENDGTLVGTGNSVEVSPNETTHYTATMTIGDCQTEASMTVKVEETPHIVSHEMLDDKSCQLNVDANVRVSSGARIRRGISTICHVSTLENTNCH